MIDGCGNRKQICIKVRTCILADSKPSPPKQDIHAKNFFGLMCLSHTRICRIVRGVFRRNITHLSKSHGAFFFLNIPTFFSFWRCQNLMNRIQGSISFLASLWQTFFSLSFCTVDYNKKMLLLCQKTKATQKHINCYVDTLSSH